MTGNTTIFSKNKLISGVRNRVQLIIFSFTIAAGVQFYIYVSQILGDGPVTVHRPTGVEGFLPIGALMGWRYFFSTGIWDTVHPAAMVFLGFAVLVSFIIRRSFCSWFCPVGTLSEWIWKTGESIIGKNFRLPVWLDMPLRGLKYALLGFFAWIILKMNPSDLAAFFESPYYRIADIKMLHFFTQMSLATAAVLVVLMILSFFVRNFWCRYACPYGAMLGIFSMVSPARITRNADSCIHCGRCARVCPSHLPVDVKPQILTPECTGCMDCVAVCPSKSTVAMTFRFWEKPVTARQAGVGILILFCVLVCAAGITGHWKSRQTDQESRMFLQMTDLSGVEHPSVQFKDK